VAIYVFHDNSFFREFSIDSFGFFISLFTSLFLDGCLAIEVKFLKPLISLIRSIFRFWLGSRLTFFPNLEIVLPSLPRSYTDNRLSL
jgi:hypothetical protein